MVTKMIGDGDDDDGDDVGGGCTLPAAASASLWVYCGSFTSLILFLWTLVF